MAMLRLLQQQQRLIFKSNLVTSKKTVPVCVSACPISTHAIFPNKSLAFGGWNNYQHGFISQDVQRRLYSKPTNDIAPASASTSKPPYNREELDLSFNNARQAFRSKSTWEILRAYIVFKLLTVDKIVDNHQSLMKFGQKVLGKTLFAKVMEATFYGHFVAGADRISIQPNIERLMQFGVKAILDYSVEEDLSQDQATNAELQACTPASGCRPVGDKFAAKYQVHPELADRRRKAKDRTFFYVNEAQCERHMEIFLQSIEAVSGATQGTGFAAIKITALGRPQFLLHLSEAIARVHRYVGAVSGKKGQIIEQGAKPEDLLRRLDRAAKLEPTVQCWLDNMTYDSIGLINVLPWQGLVEAKQGLQEALSVPDLSTGKLTCLVPPLSKLEEEQFQNMMTRLNTIFKVASKMDVRVMVDAEQTYFQPAISRITMEMMRKYNKEKAVVFNTYQCYLKKALGYLKADMQEAERQNFYFGAKLVRGAYMEQERERAALVGYEDPINPTFEATTEMYYNCIEEGMQRMKKLKETGQNNKVYLMAATHNEDTVRFVIKKMKEYGIKRSDRVISFGQLYGMCDQVTFPLGQSGYSAYKYVPYGPVNEVLPYLSRRANENRGLVGKIQKEIKLLRKELVRRCLRGKFFYRPKGMF